MSLALNETINLEGYWKVNRSPSMPSKIANLPFNRKIEMVKEKYNDYYLTSDIRNALINARRSLKKGALHNGKRYIWKPFEVDVMLNHEGPVKVWPYLDPKQQEAVEALRSQRKLRLFNMLKGGALGHEYHVENEKKNTVTTLYTDTIIALLKGTATGSQTGQVLETGIGASYNTPASSDSALGNIIGAAKAHNEQITVSLTTTFITDYATADNNGLDTTIAAPIVSAVEFDVADATGLLVGDAIQGTTTTGEKKSIIQTLSGTTVTILPALLDVPSVLDRFLQIWGEAGLNGNVGATDLFTHAKFSNDGYEKDNTRAIIVEASITLRIV